MSFLDVNLESTEEEILREFDRIADQFRKKIALKINQSYYRLVDFEFYAHSNSFQDPYTHKHELQLENSKFYLHGSGVDITFGDTKNFGGILIRGIIKLHDGADANSGFLKKQFDGPLLVATEIFSNLNGLSSNKLNEMAFIDIQQNDAIHFHPDEHWIKTKRIGLSTKAEDEDNKFRDSELRHIIVLKKAPDFKQKIKGIENLLEVEVCDKGFDEQKAIEILGYNKKFKK